VVVNPLSAKGFAQMNLLKTDRADAALLAEYGQGFQPPLWQPPAQQFIQLKQIYSVMEQLTKQQTALMNQNKPYNGCLIIGKKPLISLMSNSSA
jgi:transposase